MTQFFVRYERKLSALTLLALALVMLGVSAISYTSALLIFFGFILAIPISFIIAGLARWRWRKLVLTTSFWLGLLAFLLFSMGQPLYYIPPPLFTSYRLTIEPADSPNVFVVQEQAIAQMRPKSSGETGNGGTVLVRWTARNVSSTRKGFLLREVKLVPTATRDGVQVLAPSGDTAYGFLCTYTCPENEIELQNLPIGSFFAARDAEGVRTSAYIDEETTVWSLKRLDRGVIFAYIPAPFHHLRRILKPFIGAATISSWVIALISLIGGLVLLPIIKPILFEYAVDKIKGRRKEKPSTSEPRKVRLIIDSDGTEKEIEVRDPPRSR